ncbi:hypothetical protein [Thiohalobacter thiocyanaticus]|nr:hypothetical protein [Thiohalobacter thiocyanaticus]
MNVHPGAAPLPPNSPEPLRPPQARPAQESARPVQPAQRGEAASEQPQQRDPAQGQGAERPEGTRGGMLDVFA